MKHLIITLVVAITLMSAPATAMADDVSAIAERAFKLVQQKNYNAAFPLMLQAAEGGDCISQGTLGTMYYKGYGTAIDYTKALSWWDKAIKDGCGDAIKSYRDDLLRTNSFTADGIKYLVNQNYTLTVIRNDSHKNLRHVSIPEKVKYKDRVHTVTAIGDYAFWDCTNLTSIIIPNSVTSVDYAAFHHCTGLASVTIPNSVTSIGAYAFCECSGLTSVIIPNSVTSIGYEAFYGCRGLTNVTIPNSVTSIGDYAFRECRGLTSVNITDIAAWCRISFGVEANPLYFVNHFFINGTEVKDLVIPNSVTSIGDFAFMGCGGLKSVTIPNSVTSIGNGAFYDCTGLTSVTIPNSVTSIGDRAFMGCGSLKSVTIPNSVTSIGNNAFVDCDGLKKVTIPKSVTSIGIYAFPKKCKIKRK